MALRRQKRASAEDLYKQCALGADCLPDVKNKYEQTTLADYLLKIFGSLVYFGGLGIGSGRGSGGSLGYRPLGGRGGPTDVPLPTAPVRPSVIVDAVGPTDIIPVDAGTSSIVPLAEGGPDISFVRPDAGPGTGLEEIELFTIKDSTDEIGFNRPKAPTITSTEDGSVAILDVTHPVEKTPQVFYDPGAADVQEFTVFTADPSSTSDINIFVDNAHAGDIVGQGENIPLERLDVSTFEIEEPPQTSTPTQRLDVALNRAKDLYSRFVKQVPIHSPTFLSQPSRLAQFEFTNPAFDPEISIEFERELATVSAAPNIEFADVVKLSRPRYGTTAEGTIRVSRLGQTGTITTRSGTTIGQPIHFYYDISNIESAEAIELATFAETGTTSTIVDDILSSTNVDIHNSTNAAYTENDLEDVFNESFNNAHLVMQTTTEENETTLVPTFPPGVALKVFVTDIGNGLFVSYPTETSTTITTITPDNIPIIPGSWPDDSSLIPAFYVESDSDFSLHPSLIPKKRRRLDMF